MSELLATIIFYLFSGVTIGSAVMVIASRNPVHSVFFLILAFFNSAGLFVLLGAEYIAMTLVIVYVGAVAVLFLFVVMMLDINFTEMRQGFMRHLPLGVGIAVVAFIELMIVFYWSIQMKIAVAQPLLPTPNPHHVTNTKAIGSVLYTYYIYPFQLAGVILLVAMIGAIVLTLRTRAGVRRQSVAKQMARKREDSFAVVQVESGKGIS
ncbi:MAG: NADH-quinone oxidoreductase subunit J [Rickettsiales bacterium]|nr:NADH-quinone oxidoreductase subunit J [Rickettsiales bacterium]